MSGRAGEMRVKVVVSFYTTLPEDEAERERLYNRTDLADCISLDIELSPGDVFMEAEDLMVEEVTRV